MRIHLIVPALAVVLAAGCGKTRLATPVGHMGDNISVGPISYNVFESDWRPELRGSAGRRSPKNRFLILRVTVTNGGGKEFNLPLFHLEGADGKTYLEEDSGEGVTNWLGLIRILKISETVDGRIVFDVPPGSYKLQVLDNNDLETQQMKLVDIPFNVEQQVKVPTLNEQQ
jgi:hypothetical protein